MSHEPLAEGRADGASDVSAYRLPGPVARASGLLVGAAPDPVFPPAESPIIAEFAMLHGYMGRRLDATGEWAIDAGYLETIGGTGLQLLAAFATRERAQFCATWHESKSNVIELF